ncbi:hypothetical protein F0562_012472 [Nyssa sinensis]|uniref:Uncharacterized protein n=1 Tax=Nyssa sinensis TaxID=561372 RepID=A0A5J4ZUU1_9ASTE|nr:hypothetical protein F0562_012472 [Nyssa sinensis]
MGRDGDGDGDGDGDEDGEENVTYINGKKDRLREKEEASDQTERREEREERREVKRENIRVKRQRKTERVIWFRNLSESDSSPTALGFNSQEIW